MRFTLQKIRADECQYDLPPFFLLISGCHPEFLGCRDALAALQIPGRFLDLYCDLGLVRRWRVPDVLTGKVQEGITFLDTIRLCVLTTLFQLNWKRHNARLVADKIAYAFEVQLDRAPVSEVFSAAYIHLAVVRELMSSDPTADEATPSIAVQWQSDFVLSDLRDVVARIAELEVPARSMVWDGQFS